MGPGRAARPSGGHDIIISPLPERSHLRPRRNRRLPRQRGRGFRRRRDAFCLRDARRDPVGADQRQGAGDRLRDGRRRRLAFGFDLVAQGGGMWKDERGVNLLDRPGLLRVYQCADGVLAGGRGARARILRGPEEKGFRCGQHDPGLRQELVDAFRSKSRQYWCDLLRSSDSCVAPSLSLAEAPLHPHNSHRSTFVEIGGVTQTAPAPRFEGPSFPAKD